MDADMMKIVLVRSDLQKGNGCAVLLEELQG